MFNRIDSQLSFGELLELAESPTRLTYERAIAAHLAADCCSDAALRLSLDYRAVRWLLDTAADPQSKDRVDSQRSLASALLSLSQSLYLCGQRRKAAECARFAATFLDLIPEGEYRERVKEGLYCFNAVV